MNVLQIPMKPGRWSIQLSPDTPESVMEKVRIRRSQTSFAGFSTLLITEGWVDPGAGVSTVRSKAVYAGVLRDRDLGYQLSGAGLEIYLGDEDGIGALVSGGGTDTFANWVALAASVGTGGETITIGSVSAVGGSYLVSNDSLRARRELLDEVCEAFFMEWRIQPTDFALDADTITNLYGTDPAAHFARGVSSDPTKTVLTGQVSEYRESVAGFTNELILTSSDSYGAGTATHPNAPYWCTPWNTEAVAADRVIYRQRAQSTGGAETVGTVDDRAATILGSEFCKTSISLDVTNYSPSTQLAGKFIGVYDPSLDLYDTTADQVILGGEVCTPLTTRVASVEWDLPENAGVYLVDSNGDAAFTSRTITDLSRWVERRGTPRARIVCGELEPTWATATRRKYDQIFGG